jgi:hypothetical protein
VGPRERANFFGGKAHPHSKVSQHKQRLRNGISVNIGEFAVGTGNDNRPAVPCIDPGQSETCAPSSAR